MQVIAIFYGVCILFLEANDFLSLRRDNSFNFAVVWDHGVIWGRQTNSIPGIFAYLMMNHPEVQHLAQTESYHVVGQL